MIPLNVSGSESIVADLLQQVRWRDGGSRCIETSQKIALHGIAERSNSDEIHCNPGKKRSNTLSKQLSEINNVLGKSVNRNRQLR